MKERPIQHQSAQNWYGWCTMGNTFSPVWDALTFEAQASWEADYKAAMIIEDAWQERIARLPLGTHNATQFNAFKDGFASGLRAAQQRAGEPVGINGLTEAETSGSMSVLGLSKPTEPAPSTAGELPPLPSPVELNPASNSVMGYHEAPLKAYARAALLQSTPDARPVGKLTTCNCRWNGEEQVQSCTLHAAHVDAIHEWAERAKTAESELVAARTQPERMPLPASDHRRLPSCP